MTSLRFHGTADLSRYALELCKVLHEQKGENGSLSEAHAGLENIHNCFFVFVHTDPAENFSHNVIQGRLEACLRYFGDGVVDLMSRLPRDGGRQEAKG